MVILNKLVVVVLLRNIQIIRICMGKKTYRFCNLRNWKDFNKKQLTLLKMCLTFLLCGPRPFYGRFVGFYVNGFLSMSRFRCMLVLCRFDILCISWSYCRTSPKRPRKMQRLSGLLRKVVVYKNRTAGLVSGLRTVRQTVMSKFMSPVFWALGG